MREWLKEIRKNKRMTQNEVAKSAGLSRAYYTRIECNIRGQKLPVSTAQHIAKVLNFNWQQFYDDNECT
jgi:putative transcriptional regulator